VKYNHSDKAPITAVYRLDLICAFILTIHYRLYTTANFCH